MASYRPASAARRLAPVDNLSRRDSVMREIRRAIVRGDLVPGQKLTEVSLAEQLEVSRPTIREALAQLANEGFLVQESYRGIRVAELSVEQMRDTARVRMALDRLAIELIVADASGACAKMVCSAFEDFAVAVGDADPLVRHEAHVAFHRDLWAASGSGALVRLWPMMESQVTLQLAADSREAASPARDLEVHRTIVDAIDSGDWDRIEAALDEHTNGSVDLLASRLA